MDEEEQSKGFKVQDRRRFSAEGELKPEHRGDEAKVEQAPKVEQAAAAQPRSEVGGQAASSTAGHRVGAPEDQGGEINFAAFVVGLSTQALVHLGEIPDPQGEGGGVNLAAAQQLIDIVGMLQEKTRGNLDQQEQALMESVLFELRMKYVERSRRS